MKHYAKIHCLILAITLLAGCQPAQNPADPANTPASGGLPHNEERYHTGGAVSDAHVDPEKYRVPEDQLKAVGFEYDYDALSYELVWSDEFDYEGAPDPEKWGYDTGDSGWGNHELQYYTPGDNAQVGGDVLTITLRREDSGQYTSTRLVSRQKGDWLYGKFEVSARLPSGLGTWPAIWMLPTDWKYGDWPASGEIDIMEHVGYDQDNIVQSVHCNKYYAGAARNASRRVAGVSEEFHVYTVEWLPDKIIFYIDNEETWTYEPSRITSQPTKDHWPFDKRFHMLINLAFGGDWGGAQGTDDSYFPVTYEIDYVRVYQSPDINALTGQK